MGLVKVYDAPAQIAGDVLAVHALQIAEGFAAVKLREATGHNDGAEIDFIESLFGLKYQPYCAMGAVFCYLKALAYLLGELTAGQTRQEQFAALDYILEHVLPDYFTPSASCGVMIQAAKHRGIWKPISAGNPLPGDLTFFNFDSDPSTAEHVGLWVTEIAPGKGETEEFNTSSGQGGSQADGQGVFERERSERLIIGSIRVNRPLPVLAKAA